MGTYKLIQDIEAEDKILGPLTLRQFIFALIAVFLFYICFIVLTKGAPFMLLVFLPPALFFGFFAMPFGRDQPTEIWALAKLRFLFKPRKRIWSQSGVKELVTITVPKKIERVLTKGLSQTEVQSRLKALANTIDSRGWAVKNVDLNTYSPTPQIVAGEGSDRLLDIDSMMPPVVPEDPITAADDMLDAANNPLAQQFDSMMTQLSQDHRQQLINKLNDEKAERQADPQSAKPAADYWFMGQGQAAQDAHSAPAQLPAPIPAPDDAALSAELKSRTTGKPSPYAHLRTVQPAGTPPPAPAQAVSPPVTPPTDPAILSLAGNDDLNVSTLAREAKKAKGDDEVVISLH